MVNHFGTKEGVFAGVIWRFSAAVESARDLAAPDDVPGATRALVADYETTGELDGLERRARERRVDLLVVATDVYAWKLLRRDRGLSRTATAAAIADLVTALHPPTRPDPKEDSR